MSTISVAIKRLDPTVELPSYAYAGDAGLDLRAQASVDIAPFERVLIPTGLAIALPDGYAGFVQPRSGMALKRGLSIVNTPGLIDAHYRGELKIIAINLDAHETIHIERGERIAQLVIQAVPTVQLVEVDELDETDRGTGGIRLKRSGLAASEHILLAKNIQRKGEKWIHSSSYRHAVPVPQRNSVPASRRSWRWPTSSSSTRASFRLRAFPRPPRLPRPAWALR